MGAHLTLVLVVLAQAPPARESSVLLTAAAIEQFPLPLTQVTLELDPYGSQVRLDSPEPLGPAAKALAKSRLCPVVRKRAGGLVLQCVTGRLEAELTRTGKTTTLALRRLRGLPWRNPLTTRTRLPVDKHTLGGACPGTTADAQGECLLERGQLADAKPLLDTAVTTQLVSLRRGDLAVLLAQDAVAALGHYEAAGTEGTLGRLAHLRRCELVGCPGARDPYETVALPEPVRTEVELRQIRALALDGHRARAATLLAARMGEVARPPPCEDWFDLCVGLTSAALRDGDAAAQGLSLYVQLLPLLPAKDARLARQAADAASELGAHRFAANVLASVTDKIPPRQLGEHLSRTAAMYDDADDRVRSDVIREYAVVRLRRRLRPPSTPAPPQEDRLLERMKDLVTRSEEDLAVAGALGAASRARAVRPDPPPP